ncbi:hypothetical protein E2C01_024095 [Portunus trituberculatus]|uniref:Uncharacterized protein n=1 Tax=Portunus trituberculatus TaxID=210409 RepID=A0A5B7EC91_PORTR|nr:hypothetical protein [Portunus trituberculatus]
MKRAVRSPSDPGSVFRDDFRLPERGAKAVVGRRQPEQRHDEVEGEGLPLMLPPPAVAPSRYLPRSNTRSKPNSVCLKAAVRSEARLGRLGYSASRAAPKAGEAGAGQTRPVGRSRFIYAAGTPKAEPSPTPQPPHAHRDQKQRSFFLWTDNRRARRKV